jgi:hypothetical protein
MTKNPTFLTMVLFGVSLAAILVSTGIVAKWPQASNWVLGGLIGFAAVLLLIAIVGSRNEA